MKERIDAKMAERGQEQRNVKLGGGGIREIEFLVQTIQVLAGHRLPGILDRGTIGSLARLHSVDILSLKQQTALTRAYQFLRDVEHKLQMVHDMQTHALPDRQDKLERCAIRMGSGSCRNGKTETVGCGSRRGSCGAESCKGQAYRGNCLVVEPRK